MKSEEILTTTPTFIINQGDPYDGGEQPIQVIYWNEGDLIELRQGEDEVLIQTSILNKVFRLIKRHLPEATDKLKNSK